MDSPISGVVGLDLSLTGTGIARMQVRKSVDGNYLASYACISTTPKDSIYDRWEHILRQIRNRIDVRDVIFVEDYAFGVHPNQSNLATLAELGGIVKYVMWKVVKKPLIPVNSSRIKKWLTGSGKAQKDDMKLHAYKKFGIEFKTSDEADAYALADLGWHVLGLPERGKLNAIEKETVDKMQKELFYPKKP